MNFLGERSARALMPVSLLLAFFILSFFFSIEILLFLFDFKLNLVFLFFWLILTVDNTVVSLALICSFKRMKEHLHLGNVKSEDIPEETLKTVAETLRKSSSLKLSEDGQFSLTTPS